MYKKNLIAITVLVIVMNCFVVSCYTVNPEVIPVNPDTRVDIQQPPNYADAPGSKAIFYDTFDPNIGGVRNLWVTPRGHWIWQRNTQGLPGCEDGCLKQQSVDPRMTNAFAYVKTPHVANGVIEAKVRFVNENTAYSVNMLEMITKAGAGIMFRMKDESTYYLFRLAGDRGAVLGIASKEFEDGWCDLDNPRSIDFLEGGNVRFNEWYNLKVELSGASITCYINETPIISVNLRDLPEPMTPCKARANKVAAKMTVGGFGVTTWKSMADFEYIKVTR